MRAAGRWQCVALGLGLALSAYKAGPCWAGGTDPSGRKVIIVVFGGGTRYSESMGDPNHRFIPHLWNEIVPKGTLFTNMRVEHRVVHPNSVGSMVTGHWEWDDLDWTQPVGHATVFEVFRKARQAPDTAAWAFVYASILARIGHSQAPRYGAPYGANVVVPPTIPRDTAERMDAIMAGAAASGDSQAALAAAKRCADLARLTSRLELSGLQSAPARDLVQEAYASWTKATATTSHDAFLTEAAIRCMERFEPAVMLVAFGEIDCAHYGSWSRYVEAIQRTDDLVWRLWQATQNLPAYQGKTLIAVLPDHGRELDQPGRSGFIHHSDFYTGQGADEGCRRIWMVAAGPGVKPGLQLDQQVPITSVAPMVLEYLALAPPGGMATSALNHAR
jgi:hypothetical protein